MENFDGEFLSMVEFGKVESGVLDNEKEMRELFKEVKQNKKILDDCEEKTTSMYTAVDAEIERLRSNRENHKVIRKRISPTRKRRILKKKKVEPVRKRPTTSNRTTMKLTRQKKKIVRKPVSRSGKRMGSPIPRRSTKRQIKRQIATPLSIPRNMTSVDITPKLRKRNYVITPIQSKRDRIRFEHLNFTLESISNGSRPSKQKKVAAEGKPEGPVFVSYQKMSQVGNVDVAGYETSPQFIWSVPVSDVRRRKYFRTDVLKVFDLEFVMKVVSRGVKGKRRISFYIEYLPKEEKFEDISMEISICLLNATNGSFSLGYNSLYTYTEKNISFGWPFFGSKGKILRKGNGFVYEDNTIAFDLRVRELIVGNKPLVLSED